ncbi:MAG: hypothetical protein ACI8WB_000212 [Phenylobacterium sp.]|jgi:hypothetical protein
MNQPQANTNPPSIGVLGCGYVGQQLLNLQPLNLQPLNQQPWHQSSWYSIHNNDPKLPYNSVPFSLDNPDSWHLLPHQADWLVLTIPPAYQDREKESQRLTNWCQWMALNRPALKRLIYISTIGVYAEQGGVWTEQSRCEPSLLRGHLRLDSETILQHYFQSTAIRCGGIYGQGRNIVEKLMAGEAVFRGNKPLYRIHVDDLTGLIISLINQGEHIPSLNAVDDQAASQDEIIDWLRQQPGFNQQAPTTLTFQNKRLDVSEEKQPTEQRIVSNQRLLSTLGYRLKYPTYQTGLAFSNPTAATRIDLT